MFNPFKRKQKEKEIPLPEKPIGEPIPEPKPITTETTSGENIKPQIDLILARIDGLKLQYDALNERLNSIEKMIKEIYQLAKS